MLNPSAAAYDSVDPDDDIDPATGLPRQTPAAPQAPALADSGDEVLPPSEPVAPVGAPAPPVPPVPGAPPAVTPDVPAAPGAAPALPGQKPLPDLTPTRAEEPPDLKPPAGARQKFQRTLESPEDKAIAADQGKLTEAAVTAEQNASQVRQQAIKDEQEFRAKQTADALDHQKVLQDTLAAHDAAVQAALAKKQQYFDAARGAQFHDLWAERSTGDRVLGALAVFLGGLGGGDNKALGILNAQMQHAYDKQAADIDQKWKLYGEQAKNVEAAQKGKAEAISDLNLLQSARYEAAADQLEQMRIRQGIPAEQAASDKAVVAIRQKALDIRAQEAAATRDRVEWDTYGKVRGAGGGAGGGSADEVKVRQMVAEGKTGAEIAAATPGTNPKLRSQWMASEESLLRERKGDAGAVSSEMKEALKPITGKGGLRESQEHLQASLNKLQQNPNNPVEWTNAIDAAIRTNTGRAAIKQQFDLYTSHAGGKFDSLESWVQQAVDGNFGPTVKANLLGSMRSTLSQLQREGQEAERNFRENYESDARIANNPTARAAYEAAHKNSFGTMAGGEGITRGPAKPGQPAAAGAPKVAIPADPQERAAKAQRAAAVLGDPTKTPAQKKLAQDYLTSVGAR
jgi:hypothetical protein